MKMQQHVDIHKGGMEQLHRWHLLITVIIMLEIYYNCTSQKKKKKHCFTLSTTHLEICCFGPNRGWFLQQTNRSRVHLVLY